MTVSKKEINPEEYVIVFKGTVSEGTTQQNLIKYIQEKTLEEVILEEISLMNQFASDDNMTELNEAAKDEIQRYRNQAKDGEKYFCNIVHVYPNKARGEQIP